MADDVKVTIKPRDATTETEDVAESKVTVRVRKASDRTDTTSAVVEVADMTTSIKVNKPLPKAAPPPKPKRPVEEELLLNGTQSANCSQILEALQAGANPNVRD